MVHKLPVEKISTALYFVVVLPTYYYFVSLGTVPPPTDSTI